MDVDKLRAAFLWLHAHTPYYVHIKWDESSAHAWSDEDVAVGTTQEEDLLNDQPLAVNHEEFERWMQETEAQQDSSERGFSMDHWLLELLMQQQEGETTEDRWSVLRALAADLQGQRYIRAASSLLENLIAAVLHAHGSLELQMPPDLPMSEVATFLADMPQTEWSDELLLLYSELHTVRLLVNAEEPAVFLGGFSAAPPGEDVGQREETLEAMAAAAENIEHQAFGHVESAGAPDFVSAKPMKWQSV